MEFKTSKEENTVLYVDDRENNLTSFKATFRREFTVYTASSPAEAIQILASTPIKVAISDYKMPEVTGVTFLESVKNKFPDTIRIMLTGHADLPAVVDAINKSEIFRFLAKPWSVDDLRAGINSALKLYETRMQLVEKNKELAKAYNELDRLVFSTAHDITGPLSNILGLVDLIRSDEEEDPESYLRLIEKTTKRLQFIARDVLSFHRNKRTGLKLQKIDVQALINSVLDDHRFFQEVRGLEFKLNINQNVPFNCDKTRMGFILNNLISNAIKYQDPEKSENWVQVDFFNDEEKAEIRVADNGVGIAADILPRIFDIYYRASNKSTGAGIGLYVATEAVELVNGKMDVESEQGQGTTFVVTIPNRKLD